MTLTKMICQSKGLRSSDDRVYKLIAIASEKLLNKILSSIKQTNTKSTFPLSFQVLKDPKTEITVDELIWALDVLLILLFGTGSCVTVIQDGR